ncbi:MAG: T9SS type A sorting domain-containing protein [Bacteroidia bacterium]
MKKLYLAALLSSLFINLHAQTYSWAKREGLYEYDYGYGITTDNAGNVYTAGKYEMNANFSGTILPWQGNHDIFLAKYSPSGALTWITTAGGPSGDYAEGVACDGSNYVYIAGEIEGPKDTIKFQTSPTTTSSPVTLITRASNDVFVAKYDLNGNLLWARSAGAYQNDKALAVTYDNSGNVYICGFFNDTAYFGTSTTIYGAGGNDIFVAKYDASGTFQWVKHAGSAGRDEAKSIKCDAAGNVYICGLFSGSITMGTFTLTSPGSYYDAFIAKYAPDGTVLWAQNAGGSFDDVAWSMVLDNAGKVYITGEFNASANFGSHTLTTSGNADVFVACYDPATGSALWAKSAGGTLIDRARGIGSDGTNLFITGQFGSTASFGGHTVTAADSSDIFFAGLDNSGNFTWASSVGGPADSVETLGYESGNAICAEPSGNVYATGSLLTGGVFGTTTVGQYSRTDMFITKLLMVGADVPETNASQNIRIYPNPTTGSFDLQILNTLQSHPSLVKIYNVVGQEIDSRQVLAGDNEIDMSGNEKGVYFIEVQTEETTVREKIIIQ